MILRRKIFAPTAKADRVRRTGYTHIILRLTEGAKSIKSLRTVARALARIEKYYAVHIKTSLDAATINVVRSKKDWSEEEEV
jgi:hypothetical protein